MMITNATMSVRGAGASATNTTKKRIARRDAGTDAKKKKKGTGPGHGAPSRTTGTKTVHAGNGNRVTRTNCRGDCIPRLLQMALTPRGWMLIPTQKETCGRVRWMVG